MSKEVEERLGELLVKSNLLSLMQASNYGVNVFTRKRLVNLALQLGISVGADRDSIEIILDHPLKDFLVKEDQ